MPGAPAAGMTGVPAELLASPALAAAVAALVPLIGVAVATAGLLEGAACIAASVAIPEFCADTTAAEMRLDPVSRFKRARSVRNSAACW